MKSLRVLIGDDNEMLMKSLARLLRSRNLEVDMVTTPKEIIVKARTDNYLAIVTDLEYTQGGREGYDVLRDLKDIPTTKILFTGQIGTEYALDAFEAGADYVVLRKDSPQLLSVLDKLREATK